MSNRIFTDDTAKAMLRELAYQRYSLAQYDSLSALEKQIGAEYDSQRNGKIYATKLWKFATNQTSTGERLLDSVGKTCTPSTDSVIGQDDFLNDSSIFQWMHCNYTRDDDGTARVKSLEGMPSYRTEGAYDVGTIAPTFYWKCEEHPGYDIIYMSDSPNHALGLVPFILAVKDGMVMPYYVISSYPSVTASDGNARSQPGLAPVYNQSYNDCITTYQKKGTGYWGGGNAENLHAILFMIIKYATKNSQNVMRGCCDFNIQPKVAKAESNTRRVLVSDKGGFYEGCCVSIGDGTQTDRGSDAVHKIANRVRVKSIEEVTINNGKYYALNLELSSSITTTTDCTVTSMPCLSGETDNVVGRYDGSYLNNTDGNHTFRIHGVEYMWGQYVVLCDTVLEMSGETVGTGIAERPLGWDVYVAPKGTPHVKDAHTNYIKEGTIPYNKGTDAYGGDFGLTSRSYFIKTLGSSSSNGTGDTIFEGGSGVNNGTLREFLSLGALWDGSLAGLGLVYCGCGLGTRYWVFGSRD